MGYRATIKFDPETEGAAIVNERRMNGCQERAGLNRPIEHLARRTHKLVDMRIEIVNLAVAAQYPSRVSRLGVQSLQ